MTSYFSWSPASREKECYCIAWTGVKGLEAGQFDVPPPVVPVQTRQYYNSTNISPIDLGPGSIDAEFKNETVLCR